MRGGVARIWFWCHRILGDSVMDIDKHEADPRMAGAPDEGSNLDVSSRVRSATQTTESVSVVGVSGTEQY